MQRISILLLLVAVTLLNACSEREDVVIIHTDFGDIVVVLFDETPQHKQNFLELAKGHFYDGTTFHRVMNGFMIQGGDPNSKDEDPANDGLGGPGFTIPAEFNRNLVHNKGALAAARQPDNVNPEKASSGSQFYLVQGEQGAHHLDGGYTVFGQAISGLEVIDKIAAQPVDGRNRPLQDIKMTMEVKTMSKKKIAKEYGYEVE